MKKALYLLLVVLIALLGYLKWTAVRPGDMPIPSPSPASSVAPLPTTTPTEKLSTDTFTLEYPSTATLSSYTSPDSSTWAISYIGDVQRESGRTQTELFDGYSVSLTLFEAVGDDVARSQAQSDRQTTVDCSSATEVTPLTTTKLSELDAWTFTGGCLGTATNYYLTLKDKVLRISTMTVGSEPILSDYKKTVNQLLSSLTIL